jgi:hypothetical protein
LQVNAGTVAGNGMLTTSAVTIASTAAISPGTNSAGVLTAGGNLTLNNGSKYVFSGSVANRVASNDLVRVQGRLTLTDNWTLQVVGPGFMDGGQVTVFEYGSLGASPDLVPTFTLSNLNFSPSSLTLSNDTANSRIVLYGIQKWIYSPPGTTVMIR